MCLNQHKTKQTGQNRNWIYFHRVVELQNLIRENSTTEQEYKRYFNSLKSSVLTAFYTPVEAIFSLCEALKDNGIIPYRFLEPLAGNSTFADAFSQTFPQNETVCFEKDLLTGKILSHLHPDDKIHICPFEEIENRPDNQKSLNACDSIVITSILLTLKIKIFGKGRKVKK